MTDYSCCSYLLYMCMHQGKNIRERERELLELSGTVYLQLKQKSMSDELSSKLEEETKGISEVIEDST